MIKLKKTVTAFAVAAFMVTGAFSPISVNAGMVRTGDVAELGAGITDAGISLKETEVSGQEIKSWTFGYNNDALADQKYTLNGMENTFSPQMEILVFEKGDRTKPVKGSMRMDDAGKYVISNSLLSISYQKPTAGLKYEFTINAEGMTPGPKDVVGYILDEPAYYKALGEAEAADSKAYSDAEAAYKASTAADKEYPDRNDYNSNAKAISVADYYKTVSVSIDVAMETDISTVVTTSSVELTMDSVVADGYDIYRKVGTKYIKIATVTEDVYADKGLDANTTYSYKVRPYYYNKITGNTTYGKYSTMDATTAGSSMKLKAKINKSNKVELSWKKVKGATKYEIYRIDTTSVSSELSQGEGNYFVTQKLIATVKKSKKKYTDKTVTDNRNYRYYVRAVLPKNKKIKSDKQRYVEDSVSVEIRFGGLHNIITTVAKDGSKTLQWDKVYGADGYIVEKKDYSYEKKKAGLTQSPYIYKKDITYYTYIDGKYEAKKGDAIYSDNGTNKKQSYYYVIDTTTKIAYEANIAMKYDDATKNSVEIVLVVNNGRADNIAIPYNKDADGKELYEYGIDDKGLYSVKWSSESIYQADKTYKTIYRMTDKSYKYAISGTDVYLCDEKGNVQYEAIADWKEVTKLGKNTTSYKFASASSVDPNKKVINTTKYRIKAYKGKTQFGKATEVTTVFTKGIVSKVTAKNDKNGIKITWEPVSGASYYMVYRVKTGLLENNKDLGGYESLYYNYYEDGVYKSAKGTQVTNYVGLETQPKVVDVKAWNKAIDDDIAKSKSAKNTAGYNANDYLKKSQKLNDKITYHYQNYSYAQTIFTDEDAKKGILDYAGDIYSGNNYDMYYRTKDDKGNDIKTPIWEYSLNPVVKDCNVTQASLKAGVSYTYYVVAFFATPKSVEDYKGTNVDAKLNDAYWKTLKETKVAYNMTTGPQVDNAKYGKAAPVLNFKDESGFTVGVKTVGKAVFTTKSAVKKPALKSLKATKGKVTIKIKKKVAGADYYKIYRGTKKNGKYISVGVSANANTTKFVDSSVVKGKTYYYKVVSVVKNEANGEIESAASAIKKVKAK